MDIYKKADAWVMNMINEAYLWMYDWTGIYVGTVIVISNGVVVLNCIQKGWMWSGAIIFLCGIAIAWPRYRLQSVSVEAYNKLILAGENFPVRTVFVFLNSAMLIVDIMSLKGTLEFGADISNMLLWFLMEIKIRDRIKKDFKLPKLAMQGSSS